MAAPSQSFDTLIVTSGSTKGIVAVGALHYLKLNHKINHVTKFMGVSVGAILSYLLAIGYDPLEIIVYLCQSQLLEDLSLLDFSNINNDHGIADWDIINKHLEKMTLDKVGRYLSFRDLEEFNQREFACVTFNAKKGCKEILSSRTTPNLPCLVAIRMSCNIPIIFGEFRYGDGI
jgi:predicted acylesterase/phospholipase RssA